SGVVARRDRRGARKLGRRGESQLFSRARQPAEASRERRALSHGPFETGTARRHCRRRDAGTRRAASRSVRRVPTRGGGSARDDGGRSWCTGRRRRAGTLGLVLESSVCSRARVSGRCRAAAGRGLAWTMGQPRTAFAMLAATAALVIAV